MGNASRFGFVIQVLSSNILEYFRSFFITVATVFYLYSYFVIEECTIEISRARNNVFLTYLLANDLPIE